MRFDQIDIRNASKLFKALSHPDRLKLACQLMDGRKTTEAELITELGWPQSTMNRHLTLLRDAGLLHTERHGNSIEIQLPTSVVNAMMTVLCDVTRQVNGVREEHNGLPAVTGIGEES